MAKIALIGTSGHFQYALDGVVKVTGAQMVGVAPGHDMEILHDGFLRYNPQIPIFKDYRKMLDVVKPDVVVVNPYFHLHAPIAIHCLERSINVFCEKPLALNLEDLARAQKALGQSRLGLMMDYRYHPAFCASFRAIQEGRIGEVIHITTQKSYKNCEKPVWQRQRQYYGGTISWVGSHSMDWIICSSRGKRVSRIIAKDTILHNRNNGEMESAAYCCFEFEGGGQALASIDYLRPSSAPTHGDDRLRVVGSQGILEVMSDRAMLINENEGVQTLQIEPQPLIFEDFLNAIMLNRPFRQSHEEIWRLSKLCIAAQKSADSGEIFTQTI